MKENDVRPKKLFEKYIELEKKDIDIFFKNTELVPLLCPACNKKANFSFNKFGFNYDECNFCKTLFVNPRPKKEAFDNYYSNSESSKFWANEFYKETEKERRIKIWKPKAQLVTKKIKNLNIKSVVDIGGGYGIFIEEFQKINPKISTLIIEPSQQLAQVCRNKNIKVISKFFEDIDISELPKDKTLFVSFELFEHLHNPRVFLENLYSSMKQDDIFLFTTLNGLGLDIQVLWDKSKAISPPHHLNFFNPKSIKILFENIGFSIIEISTPGKLDINIMANNIKDVKDRFWKNFLLNSSDEEKKDMQEFISKQNLSSHIMVIVKKL
jgi:2-polyprenyl-3-methyl-5-hydroxy-6-metoxy-1,4-benzoquinol methylase